MTTTPKNVLRVACPVCGVRRGLQCSIEGGVGKSFDIKAWAHEARIKASRGWCLDARRHRGLTV